MLRSLRTLFLGVAVLAVTLSSWAAIDTVIVRNFEFVPPVITINEGDTVVWHNIQGNHNVHHMGNPSRFGNAPAIAPWFYSFAFDSMPPDSYRYDCTVHGFTGTVVIPHIDTVIVRNYQFSPAHIVINHGDTVVWHNIDGFHNIHHLGSPSLFGNQAANAPWFYQFIFNNSGDSTFHYECQIHPTLMQGSVSVLGPSVAPPPREVASATDFVLDQNYPNPFNSTTMIRFSVPNETMVRLTVLDVLGQTVNRLFEGRVSAGEHQVRFDADGMPSGIYFYRLEAPGAMVVRTMNFIK